MNSWARFRPSGSSDSLCTVYDIPVLEYFIIYISTWHKLCAQSSNTEGLQTKSTTPSLIRKLIIKSARPILALFVNKYQKGKEAPQKHLRNSSLLLEIFSSE